LRRRRLLVPDVEAGAGNALLLQRIIQRALVVDEAARGGDEEGMWLHQRELARADHAAAAGIERTADRNEIRALQEIVELDLLAAPRRHFLRRQIRIIGDHLHVQQAFAKLGDAAADVAEPDDADRLALRLIADQRIAIDIALAAQRAVGLQNAL